MHASVCQLTCKVALREEMLDKVCIGREEQVVQLVHAHADGGVDVQPPAQVGAERLHLAWRESRNTKAVGLGFFCFVFFLDESGDQVLTFIYVGI